MKRFMSTTLAGLSMGLLIFIAGCSTKVTRVSTDSTIDLSGRWNDADSRLVAEEMIKDCLGQRWLYKWDQMNKRPTVILGKITNSSHEHINTGTFTKDLERTLLNSGKVDFVANKNEREQLHEETGADLMLIGSINTIVDQEGNRAVLYYQTNMELVDLESHQKVWIGEKKIKKYIERATTSF
jgi:PBP1b-binding outer membrane lipoprotein LpoB